jgi:hypothetical protein
MGPLTATLLWAVLAAEGEGVALPADTSVLRLDDSMTVSWALPAGARPDCRPLLDPGGVPWLECGGRFLDGPERRGLYAIDRHVDDAAWLPSGALFFSAGGALAPVRLSEAFAPAGGPPILAFHARMRFPYSSLRLFAGSGPGDALYVVGRDEKAGRDEVVVLQREGTDWVARKLVSISEGITAVAGDGVTTAVAAGGRIVLLRTGPAGKAAALEPLGDVGAVVTGLAWSPDVGVLYATAEAVGFAGSALKLDLVRTPAAGLALRGTSLFVSLSQGRGVLRVEGMGFLKLLDDGLARERVGP